MEKRYKLKFAVPGILMGQIIKPLSGLSYGYRNNSGTIHMEWANDFVENNPDWFEEVKEPPIALYLPYRRCGNTTRLIDRLVQDLFINGYCIVIDHAHRDGNVANRHAFGILQRRLLSEHGIKMSDLVFDEITNKLSFKTPR